MKVAVTVFLFLLLHSTAFGAPDVPLDSNGNVPGTPFQALQDQIDTIELTPGPAGPTGPAGADGTNGTNGTNGADGVDGAQGPVGVTGSSGEDGATIIQHVRTTLDLTDAALYPEQVNITQEFQCPSPNQTILKAEVARILLTSGGAPPVPVFQVRPLGSFTGITSGISKVSSQIGEPIIPPNINPDGTFNLSEFDGIYGPAGQPDKHKYFLTFNHKRAAFSFSTGAFIVDHFLTVVLTCITAN